MHFIESILSGIWATMVMDLFARTLSKGKLLFPFITPDEVGRWILYMFRGKMIHNGISTTPPLKHEGKWYFVSHYLIGIFLACLYLILASTIKEVGENAWTAIVFGILTVILPWFWLLPGIGLGVMANRSKNRLQILRTNLINHTVFGIGLYLWVILLHDLFAGI